MSWQRSTTISRFCFSDTATADISRRRRENTCCCSRMITWLPANYPRSGKSKNLPYSSLPTSSLRRSPPIDSLVLAVEIALYYPFFFNRKKLIKKRMSKWQRSRQHEGGGSWGLLYRRRQGLVSREGHGVELISSKCSSQPLEQDLFNKCHKRQLLY